MQKKNTFYAMLARMKYIKRWALMRNAEEENISEHSLEVAILSHALAFIGNTRLSKNLNADRIAMLGVYHDCTEIITGDMPTPIKYENPTIQDAYKQIEKTAAFRLLNMLPDDLRTSYESYFTESSLDAYELPTSFLLISNVLKRKKQVMPSLKVQNRLLQKRSQNCTVKKPISL